ncbi:hypothetical protein ABTZ57_31660 [Streptomyces sp. NPDC094048]|uniref:hypothetical protein n=1 Tax=unclassified Streptomyces TaxID=2593676 RepID=UPI0033312794|nr:hypothetical protein OG306_17300 [Streptomyces sp. NBC_01241]
MPEPEFRTDIVALLCDADFKQRPDTHTWTHRDGRPFSKEEQARVFRATRAELEEVREQIARYRKYVQEKTEAAETMQHFLAPFMQQLTQKDLGNATQLMRKDERTEFDRLFALLFEPERPFAANTF